MRERRLITAGEAFEDLIFVGLDRLPGPGEEVRTNTFVSTIGGGAVITAVAAARLGVNVELVSALGPAAVTRLKTEARLRIRNLRKPHEPHAISAALSTQHDRAFVTFDGVNAVLEPRLSRALAAASAAHAHLAFYPRDCDRWMRVVRQLRRKGITTSWDFGWNEVLARDPGLTPLIDALDFVFLNELEARLYTGTSSMDDALAALRARPATSIVKLGAQGSRWIAADGEYHAPALAVKKVVDTTGAGDAFNGGFLWALLRGETPQRCLEAGNAVGAASTRKAGGIEALPRAADLKGRRRNP